MTLLLGIAFLLGVGVGVVANEWSWLREMDEAMRQSGADDAAD